ncbi:uncharacterized protein LOC107771940 [Nicotiana tabacum]|uniref:Uncharacterized protein LOC107771940 n=1 Tax=Nicotiana tabacum TaxID=4097 RepID=A0AC58T5I4_TOBAC
MKALVWNYTGMGVGGGSLTVPFLKETTPLHSPNMIFLSETKNRDRIVQRVQRQLEMAHVITVEPMGLSGGLALFWNDNIQKKRRFYFDKRWVDREKVQNIVSEAWSNDYIGFEQSRVNFKIKKYGRSLVAWVRGGNVHVAEILRKYEQSSSQVVNLDKSAICFSRNVMEGEKVEIFSLLGQQQRNEMGMYLELPAIVGRSKKKMLEFIKDRVKTKIKGWKGKFLSTAGKEVMLKSGQTEDKRKMQIEKWEILCDSKSRGGLGFRDLKAFNMALLAKQARRSWIWRSILWGRDLLVTGLRWRISDGKNINVWPNPWIPRKNGFTPKSIQMQNNLDLKVVDLIDEDTHTWKLHKISTTFEPEDVDAILSIPISIIGLNDRLLWHHSKSRNYEVKSCYYLAKGLAGKTISSSEAQNLDKTCKICGFEIEDIEHMLFRCPRSQLVWKQSPINCPDIDSIPDFSVWWYNLFLNAKHFPESTELLDLSVNLMWQIWKDTGLRCDDRHTSIGVATLNSLGKPLYAHRSSIQYVGKTMTAEAIGIRKALECAITLGWKSVKILSDAKNVVDMIQKQVATSWEIEILCEDIWKLSSLLDHVEFLYIPRKLNKMTPKVPKDPNGVKAHKEVKAPKAPKQPIIPPGPYVPVAPPT